MSLHQNDLQKLAKLLGMLGSSHDGEVVSAARKASAFVAEKDATWFEALGISETVEAQPAHHEQARELLGHKAVLTTFEREFLVGIMAHAKLSEKQVETLAGIQRKVAAASAMG